MEALCLKDRVPACSSLSRQPHLVLGTRRHGRSAARWRAHRRIQASGRTSTSGSESAGGAGGSASDSSSLLRQLGNGASSLWRNAQRQLKHWQEQQRQRAEVAVPASAGPSPAPAGQDQQQQQPEMAHPAGASGSVGQNGQSRMLSFRASAGREASEAATPPPGVAAAPASAAAPDASTVDLAEPDPYPPQQPASDQPAPSVTASPLLSWDDAPPAAAVPAPAGPTNSGLPPGWAAEPEGLPAGPVPAWGRKLAGGHEGAGQVCAGQSTGTLNPRA